MRLGSFTYLLKQGAKNTYLNKAMSFASIGVLTACLVLVGLAVLLSENIKNIVGFVQSQNEIVVYVDDGLSAEKEANLDRQIRSMPNVSEIEYISKEQAFDNQKEKLGDLLDGYENEDVFPASYSIKIKDLEKIDDNVEMLTALEGIYKVDAPTDFAELMVKTDKGITFGSSVVVAVLLVVALVIIINTIKITVFTRRFEINIMKYVGATNGFIRMPFLVEGMILGAISAVLSFFIVWYVYAQVFSGITADMTGWFSSAAQTLIPFKTFAPMLLVTYLVVGSVIGGMGSALSIRKHLKV